MATFVKFQPFVESLAEGTVNLSNDLEIALSASAPTATWDELADVTQIDYTNLSSRALQNITSSQSSGTYTLDADNLTLTASGAVATFRYIILFDQGSTGDKLIGYWDHGSNVTMASGDTYVITFDAAGILTIA